MTSPLPPTPQAGHILYTDDDTNPPSVICDSGGSVVLALCKVCNLAEVELDLVPYCPGSHDAARAALSQAEGAEHGR